MQLLIDVVDMCPDRFKAYEKLVGDFFVTIAFCQEIEHFTFSSGEIFHFRILLRNGPESFDHLAGDGRRHGRAAMVQIDNGIGDLAGRAVF